MGTKYVEKERAKTGFGGKKIDDGSYSGEEMKGISCISSKHRIRWLGDVTRIRIIET